MRVWQIAFTKEKKNSASRFDGVHLEGIVGCNGLALYIFSKIQMIILHVFDRL